MTETKGNNAGARSITARLFAPPAIGRMAPCTKVIVYALLIAWSAFVLFPIYWVLITSFKLPIDVNNGPFFVPWLDFTPSLHAWRELFIIDYEDTLKAYFNSIIIALCSTLLGVAVGSMAAYALVRIEYKPKFGTIVLFVLSMIIVYREEGDLRWSTIRRRLWLNKPRDPRTGEPRGRLWLWLIPLMVLGGALAMGLSPFIIDLWNSTMPFLTEPAKYNLSELQSPEMKTYAEGAWWLMGLFFVLVVFNTFLGEEFLFRGVLLPKMNGVFGGWDWVANGVLFGLYHVHQPWGILGSIIAGVFLFALPARRYRSSWMAIITHSWQSLFIMVLVLGLVLGLA